MVNDVGAGRVPPRVAEPLAAGRHVAARDARGVVDPAVPARVLDEVALAVVVPVLPGAGAERLLEAERRDPEASRPPPRRDALALADARGDGEDEEAGRVVASAARDRGPAGVRRRGGGAATTRTTATASPRSQAPRSRRGGADRAGWESSRKSG